MYLTTFEDEDEDNIIPMPTHINDDVIDKAQDLLESILPDEDWGDAHHADTPKRFAKMLYDLTHERNFRFTYFPNTLEVNEMVLVKDIPVYSLCAHHLIPFFGKAHVAYIPQDRVAGLSKLARTVKETARGLWVQEHLNDMISMHLEENLQPQGSAVVIEAEHLCMSMRGAEIPGAKTTTSTMTGVFLDPSKKARDEFLALIRNGVR